MRSAVSRALPALGVILLYWVVLSSRPPGDSAAPQLSDEESLRLAAQVKDLLGRGRHQEALAPALRLSAGAPGNHIYIEHLALIYSHLNRPREEAAMWERYMQYAPRPIEACPHIGKAYEKQERMEDAISAYERCLAVESEADTLAALGHALELQNRLDQAEQRYREGLKAAPEAADLELGLARIALRRGDVAQGYQRASRVIARHPGNSDAMLVLGMAAWRQGKPPEAKGWLERGFRLAATDPDFPAFLGRIAEAEHRYPTALSFYNRALELAPGYREIAELRDRLQTRHP